MDCLANSVGLLWLWDMKTGVMEGWRKEQSLLEPSTDRGTEGEQKAQFW